MRLSIGKNQLREEPPTYLTTNKCTDLSGRDKFHSEPKELNYGRGHWTYPVLRKGWKRRLELDDYREIPEYLQTKNLDRKFSKIYAMKDPSIWNLAWALFKVAQDNITISWFNSFIVEIIQKPLQPLFFALMLAELQKKEDYDHKMALIYAFSTCGFFILHPLSYYQHIYHVQIAGMRIRSTLCSAVYRKITRISPQGLMTTNTGQIMNIMTNDINRFDSDFRYLNYVVSTPVQCILVCIILWFNLGPLPVIGIFGLLIMIPVQILFGNKLYKLRKKMLKATDARIKLIHEIICSMKIIKLYAWEDSFWKQIHERRTHEFNQLKRITNCYGGSLIIVKNMSNVVIFLTMVGFFLQNEEKISVPNVYLAMTMFYSVKYSMTEYFANGLNSIGQLSSSLQRIQRFLSIEEYSAVYGNEIIDSIKEKLIIKLFPIVNFKKVYSSYGMYTENILNGISFKLNSGDLLCVIGEVGSGKTSLLKTVLKEMVIKTGSVKVRGKIAYACQQSWIFSDTIKNNIIFGSKYNEKRYKEIIDACCLSKDINNMPNGDETVVGERGIRLSGGQRARVSLARALYYDADIYLLDDPLSAVDVKVANHLYSRCIQGFLANKIRILVTHQVNYLRQAPSILLLRKGEKPLYGTYEDLLEMHPHFMSFFTHELHQEVIPKEDRKIEQYVYKDKADEGQYKLDKIENATSKLVPLGIYKEFFRAAGNPILILVISLLLNIIYSLIFVGFDYWIKLWIDAEDQRNDFTINGNMSESTDHAGFFPNVLLQNRRNTLLFLLAVLIFLVLFSIPTIMFDITFCIRAAKNLHDRMFGKLLYAPVKFFNCEILNRFTKDIGQIDDLIPIEYQVFVHKVNATECKDHRTISLIVHASKIMLKMLTRRVEYRANSFIGKDQFGFRKERGTREAIGVMRTISKRYLEHGKDVYVCFIDYEKAFDRVNWTYLLKLLKQLEVDWRDRKLITALYMNQSAVMRVGGNTSDKCTLGRGVRQGCLMSPVLFNIYGEAMIQDALHEMDVGVSIGGRSVKAVRFADDTALVASSVSDLQMMMDKLNASVELYGMRINEKKTKVMKITRYQYEVINITLKGRKLEQVRQYKYLGSILDDEGKCTKDVKARIAMAKQAFMKRKELLIKNISLYLKKRLVKSLIWSVALYGSETWTIRVDERSKLEAFEMWVWRNILKIKWSDKISNEDVLKLVDEERAMMGTIHKRQRKWIGHILRSENMLRDVMEGHVMGRRQRGRQRIKMLDGMKDGKSYAELKEESQDPQSTSSIGFFIQQLVFIYTALQANIKYAIELQSKFTSVERVLEYGKITSEEYEGSAGEDKPSDDWPQKGSISASNLSLSYDMKNYVLKDICFSIIGGQKELLVVQEHGKTSLLNAIFRLEEPTGRLIIDGIDVSKLGLHQLRKKLTVIPQMTSETGAIYRDKRTTIASLGEPTLFQNTLRYNLDPFGDYCDAKIWEALESVMDDGKIIELDSPRNLVQNVNSQFYKMIMETESAAPLLIKQAMESEFKFFETE
ncbi:Multidrug resistance-associated protein 4 [Nymphon striatum]|nr:Multidrug resistance-associated protein 4 [Nymphon striatum]